MKRVPGSKRLIAAVIQKARACELSAAEAVRCQDKGMPGAALALSMCATSISREAFHLVGELKQAGAFA